MLPDHTRRTRTCNKGRTGNPTCQRRSTRQRTWTASRPMFAEPSLVSCRETWRPYVPHFSFATTHRTVIVEDRRLRLTQLSSPGIARHGMASGWGRSGDARGDFCLGFIVHCGNFVVVMAKHNGLFSYVNRACGSLVMSCEVSAAYCE